MSKHTPSLTAQGSAQSYLPVSTSAASIPPDTGAAAFSQLRLRVERMVEAAEKKRGRAGYHAALDRLRVARSALLDAENRLNRQN